MNSQLPTRRYLNQIQQMIHEVKSSDWPAFCRRLTEQRAGATVKMEIVEPDGSKTEHVASAVFESMAYDDHDACNNVITLRLKGSQEVVHEILDPIRITLHPSGEDAFNPLQIVAENHCCPN